ncbi:MAG: M3 family metallopeptidase [Gemmatimonadota bacterium]
MNPLLEDAVLVPFDRIRADDVEPGIRQALSDAQADLDALKADGAEPTWDGTLGRLDALAERLSRRIAPASHLISVAQSPELRDAYNAVLPDITAFWSSLHLDPALWARIEGYAGTSEAEALTGLRRRHLEKTLREFRRAGADLPPAAKARLREIHVELASLEQKFSENVLDATAAYELHIADEARLEGVPEAARRRARARAKEQDKEGWLLTLDYPSVEPILKHCADRALRKEIYTAHALRCREGAFDNRSLIARILRLRDELASVLGYATFADYQLEDRMARSGARARAFEADLVDRTRPYWQRDVEQLREHASFLDLDELRPWDVAFLIEKLRKAHFDLDAEALRPYFPLDRVLAGMFEIVERVFGFRVRERENSEVWHPDVQTYELLDEAGTVLGVFYTDWFPRKEKRPGAWMDAFATGGPTSDGFRPHVGTICGNFTPPQDGTPALLTHEEVETTFHEFGHLLHHCTSRVEIPSRAGIHVAWDWVELPSQIMENWTWQREALDLFARHHETGERLPAELYGKMIGARRFMGGWTQMRQLSFGTVDLDLHLNEAGRLRREHRHLENADLHEGIEVMEHARGRFAEFAPTPEFADYHLLTSFSHLFAGGYAAGYYSYLWSEVLDADAFTRFQESGVLDPTTGRAYVRSILSRGDAEDPEVLFREFMGRDPDPEALLERNLGPALDPTAV